MWGFFGEEKFIILILVSDCDDICKRVCGLRDFLKVGARVKSVILSINSGV